MKRTISFLTSITFLTILTNAQVGGTVMPGGGVMVTNASRPPVYLSEVFSARIEPKYMAGMDGSPYVFDEFLLARVVLDDGRFADSAYVRINAYRDKLHFKDERGEEMQSTALIREVTILDSSSSWYNVVFRSSFDGNLGAFYQVVEDGDKIQLMKKLKVILWETKALGSEDK